MTRWTILLFSTIFLLLGQRSDGQTKGSKQPDEYNFEITTYIAAGCYDFGNPDADTCSHRIILSQFRFKIKSIQIKINKEKKNITVYPDAYYYELWDGLQQNKTCYCPQGTYSYSLTIIAKDGKKIKKRGQIYLQVIDSNKVCK